MSKTAKEKREEENKSKIKQAEYFKRLIPLRKAQDFSKKGNIPRAVEYYLTYLTVLARYHDTEIPKLNPSMFDPKKDQAELLLLSQVFWDLSKSYDRNPKLRAEAIKYIGLFVKFTIGFKFQYLNSELIRKYIRKGRSNNLAEFKRAYKEIRVNSKKCYIATMCFGEDHHVTAILRKFKYSIQNNRSGDKFIEIYYRFSPPLVQLCKENPVVSIVIKSIAFPLLYLFAKIINLFILPK